MQSEEDHGFYPWVSIPVVAFCRRFSEKIETKEQKRFL